jgi:hypothetical protein
LPPLLRVQLRQEHPVLRQHLVCPKPPLPAWPRNHSRCLRSKQHSIP